MNKSLTLENMLFEGVITLRNSVTPYRFAFIYKNKTIKMKLANDKKDKLFNLSIYKKCTGALNTILKNILSDLFPYADISKYKFNKNTVSKQILGISNKLNMDKELMVDLQLLSFKK